MTLPAWHEEAVAKKRHRKDFDCSDSDLNSFVRDYARQSHGRGAAKTFVAIDDGDSTLVHGYYTLSPASIEYARASDVARRGMGRFDIGAFRLGRLAISKNLEGQEFGGQLPLAVGDRCLRATEEVGGTAMLIGAKNDRVAAWYSSYRAVPRLDAPLSLLPPLETVARALRAAGKL